MMNKEFTLTKEEFIRRSMKGEVFKSKESIFFCDMSKENPFRINEYPLKNGWCYFNDETLFTLEEPKPTIERRWIWLKDCIGSTSVSNYISDERADKHGYAKDGWYKKEDDYIDVEIQNENT